MKITKHDYGAKSYPNCCLIGAKGNVRGTTFIIMLWDLAQENISKYLQISKNISRNLLGIFLITLWMKIKEVHP